MHCGDLKCLSLHRHDLDNAAFLADHCEARLPVFGQPDGGAVIYSAQPST